ncbi:hypothetical protein K458DRAFT_391978 [Lentithecium fluviatile CBS 122367]|uniref:Uncharacterized protein n=1 Tax=Lentithecium fluviatile CBS 122367 TaxID=1168545 RepID=A0A6G1ITB2_9PLEO|nr:hypothetical protein K458DRAFT_391978 [Lentithecium fluviatile CBS 122367]
MDSPTYPASVPDETTPPASVHSTAAASDLESIGSDVFDDTTASFSERDAQGATEISEVVKVTAADVNSQVDLSKDSDLDSLFRDERQASVSASPVVSASPAPKRKRADSHEGFIELDSTSESDPNRPTKKTKPPAREATAHVSKSPKPLPTSNPRVVKLKKSFTTSRITARPTPLIGGQTHQIPQKVSLGAQIATPYDAFSRRKVAEDVSNLHAKMKDDLLPAEYKPATSFRSWKDPHDDNVTWKVFPKSTPRMKHRGGNIVVANWFRYPVGHPDIFIEEWEEDPKCWIARVENISEKALEDRRQGLLEAEKGKRVQKGRSSGTGGRGKGNGTGSRGRVARSPTPPRNATKSQAMVEAEEWAKRRFVEKRKMTRKTKGVEQRVKIVRSGMRSEGLDIDRNLFG